jgi:hypothetical protein
MVRLLGFTAAVLSVTGCGQVFYPPPPQRSEQPHRVIEILDMTGGRPTETWGTIVSGVHTGFDPNADWRWVAERAVFQFKLEDTAAWSLSARITAAHAVLDKTGPQRVTFAVNGQTVGTVTLDVSRRYDLSFPLAAELLKSAAPVVVDMNASPCLPQEKGPPFCVLLHKIGFVKESN